MPVFQVQYKHQSSVYVSDIECDSVDSVYSLFDGMISAEILEIRKYVYEKKKYKKDNGNYFKSLSFIVFDDVGHSRKIVLKKIKKSINVNEFILSFKKYLKFRNGGNFNLSNIKYH